VKKIELQNFLNVGLVIIIISLTGLFSGCLDNHQVIGFNTGTNLKIGYCIETKFQVIIGVKINY